MKVCPKCRRGSVLVQPIFKAAPPGTYSLAGEQEKVAIAMKAIVSCTSCDLNVAGRLENAS